MSVESARSVFPGVLAAMKRQGSRILVVGNTGERQVLCSRLLGDGKRTRQQLIVSPGTDEHRCHTRDHDGFTTSANRGALLVESGGQSAVTVSRLSMVADTIVREIDTREEAGLAPAELRLCVDSLDPLLEEIDIERLSLFLESILTRVRHARGMGHVHTTQPYDSDTVQQLAPLFDIVIEVELDPKPRQRIHLQDHDVSSCWLPLRD